AVTACCPATLLQCSKAFGKKWMQGCRGAGMHLCVEVTSSKSLRPCYPPPVRSQGKRGSWIQGFGSSGKWRVFSAAFPRKVFGKRDRSATSPRTDQVLKVPA